MKLLMFTSGNNLDEMLTHTFIDCCVDSPSLISSFLEEIESKWKLKSSGSYNYLKAITYLMDFRKANGVSDHTLRTLTVTEVSDHTLRTLTVTEVSDHTLRTLTVTEVSDHTLRTLTVTEVSDHTLRTLTVTEVYLRRGMRSLSRCEIGHYPGSK